VVVSVGILTLLAGSGVIFMTKFLGQSNLRSEHTLVLSLLKEARAFSLANRNGKPHGVKVLASTYVIFEGWTYAGRNSTYDATYNRDTNTTVTGASEILFYNLSGKSATTTLTFANPATTTTYAINVNTEGSIDW
jgi:hypothetical protein